MLGTSTGQSVLRLTLPQSESEVCRVFCDGPHETKRCGKPVAAARWNRLRGRVTDFVLSGVLSEVERWLQIGWSRFQQAMTLNLPHSAASALDTLLPIA